MERLKNAKEMQYLSMKNMKKYGEEKKCCKSSKPLSVLARNRLAMNSRLSQERKTPSVMIPLEDTAIFGLVGVATHVQKRLNNYLDNFLKPPAATSGGGPKWPDCGCLFALSSSFSNPWLLKRYITRLVGMSHPHYKLVHKNHAFFNILNGANPQHSPK